MHNMSLIDMYQNKAKHNKAQIMCILLDMDCNSMLAS